MGCLPAESAAVLPPCAALLIDPPAYEAPARQWTGVRSQSLALCVTGAASGLLMAGCFWPVNLPWLAWIALVPLLVMLCCALARQAWLGGTVLAVTFYGVGLAWFLDVDVVLGAGLVIALSLWMGLGFCVTRLLMDRLRPWAMLWALPLVVVGQEVLRCEGLARLRFPFLAWGYSQSHNLWLAQIASLTGVYGITFLIVLVNACLAWAVVRRSWKGIVPAAGSVGLVLLLAVVAQPADYTHQPRIPAASIQVTGQHPELIRDLTRQAATDHSAPGCWCCRSISRRSSPRGIVR